MGKRIGAILLTIFSYILIYSGIRYLIKRFMGEDAPYGRFAATLGTLALSPRFSYENGDGEKRIQARWLLFRKKRTVFTFGEKDEELQKESAQEHPLDEVSGEEEESERKDDPSVQNAQPNPDENGSAL